MIIQQSCGCRHEKWDGSGYPRGLKGEELPLTARICAVVEVFVKMMAGRPDDGSKAHLPEHVRQV